MDFGLVTQYGEMALTYGVAFLFVLTIVVFFHELGHFLVARWCGVRVESFSVGFGREIFGFTDRHETRWKVGWIPLGGYVKFLGDENAASVPNRDDEEAMKSPDSFHAKSVAARSAIVAAGPIANFILAVVIFALMFSINGKPILAPIVGSVQDGTAAARAGFMAGDRIIEIDGLRIDTFTDLTRVIERSADKELEFLVERDNAQTVLKATPELSEKESVFGDSLRAGVLGVRSSQNPDDFELRRYDPASATWAAVKETYSIIEATLGYLGRVVSGNQSADQLGGPLRIAQIAGQAATLGFSTLISITALLSVSIGLINLFPVPMLDGGHLVYYMVEAVRGRPLSDSVQDMGFRIGLAMVLMLMLFVTWNDLVFYKVF